MVLVLVLAFWERPAAACERQHPDLSPVSLFSLFVSRPSPPPWVLQVRRVVPGLHPEVRQFADVSRERLLAPHLAVAHLVAHLVPHLVGLIQQLPGPVCAAL